MRVLPRGLLVGIILTLALMQFAWSALAQPAGTPVPGTPAAGTPVAIDNQLAGRLGGSLQSMTARFGEPDFTSQGLIRYNAVELHGIPTILVVYYDAAETVTRLALVYAERPAAFGDTVGILPTAAAVAPADGSCDAAPGSSDFGNQVYSCHSNALATIFTPDRLAELGVTAGEPGDYSIAIDPLPDDYFELIVQPGTDGTSLAPTPLPTEASASESVASPAPNLDQQYPPLANPAALIDGDIPMNEALSFTGEIKTLQVAEFGKQFRLGADQSLGVSSLFQVELPRTGPGEPIVLFAGYNGDATILAVGDTVTVYGINYGIQCFDNALDEEVCQPLIAVDMVEKQ